MTSNKGDMRPEEESRSSTFVTEGTVIERSEETGVVRIVSNSDSTLSDDGPPQHSAVNKVRSNSVLTHCNSDDNIYNESKSKVIPPRNIKYVRSGTGLKEIIGSKVITKDTRLPGVSYKETELYANWMEKSKEELSHILRSGDPTKSLSDLSRHTEGTLADSVNIETNGFSDYDATDAHEIYQIDGFNLGQYHQNMFSISSDRDGEQEYESA